MDIFNHFSISLIDALFAILLVMYLERKIKQVRDECAPNDVQYLDKTGDES